jgi:predicted lactoylglutathione lyase
LTLQTAEKVDDKMVEQAVVSALSVQNKYAVEDVVKAVKSVGASVSGPAKELVGLFSEVDELEAVAKGQEWVKANGSWIEGFSE